MDLNYRHFGKGPALIILHGLYGSSDNWLGIGRKLARDFEVFLIDQRNHGKSPHSVEHNYILLKHDLLDFMNKHNIEKSILIGHSMGGKTAMFFAADYPQRTQALIVVDISPRSYKNLNEPADQVTMHMNIMSSMMSVDFSVVNSRTDIDRQLSPLIRSAKIRRFLMKNVSLDKAGNYFWKLNIKTIYNQLPEIMDGLDISNFPNGRGIIGIPVLFIKGEKSDYISDLDYPVIRIIFPKAEVLNIPEAGHWLHAEQPDLFLTSVKEFIWKHLS